MTRRITAAAITGAFLTVLAMGGGCGGSDQTVKPLDPNMPESELPIMKDSAKFKAEQRKGVRPGSAR